MCAWYTVSVAPGAWLPAGDLPGARDEPLCVGPLPAGPRLTEAVAAAATVRAAAGAARTRPGTSALLCAGVLAAVGTGLAAAGTGLAGAGTGSPGAGAELGGAGTGLAARGDGAADDRPGCADALARAAGAGSVDGRAAPPGAAWLLDAAGPRPGADVWPADRAAGRLCVAAGWVVPAGLPGEAGAWRVPAAECPGEAFARGCGRPGIIALPGWLTVGALAVGSIRCGVRSGPGLEFAGGAAGAAAGCASPLPWATVPGTAGPSCCARDDGRAGRPAG